MLLLCTESDKKLWKQRKHSSFSLFGFLGAKENLTLFGWSPSMQYCTCFVWVSLCVVSLCFCSPRPHCTGVELSGPLFVLNVRLSLPSSPGVRSGGSGSVMLWTDLGSVHAISCRCAPHSGVGTRCCVKRCGLCLHFKHTLQVCIRENTERKKMSGLFKWIKWTQWRQLPVSFLKSNESSRRPP